MDDILCDADRQLDQPALYWVGIGASAGGLEALRELGRHLPEDAGATYIVTQHMAPQHKSMMSELVGREASLPVLDIVDGMEPEANHIYITPPNQDLAVEGNKLRLHEPSKEPGAPKPSVNRFFRSLATELGERAVGVILSGTGSDGAYGIQAIRAAGGITIAQDEGTAKYGGMPHAAIESGCVDLVMPPADIGVKLGLIIQAPRDLENLKHTWNSGDDRRVFKKRHSVAPTLSERLEHRPPSRTQQPAEVQRRDDLYGPDMAAMFDALVKSIGPNCLLATRDLQLRRAYGDVSPYVALAKGDLRMTVTSMLRPDYRDEVRTLITACQRQLKTRYGVVRTDPADPSRREQIRVYPVCDESRNEHFFLIVFADWYELVLDGEAIEEAPESARQRIIDLERALSATRESLQQANEELETSNEELQAQNEELQSTNQELTTVNEELHINGQELDAVNQDLDSILGRVGTPFIVVDKELAITRCSAEAERFFGIEEPKSRPHVSVCRLPAGFPRLADLIVEVLETDRPIDRHIVGERESANLAIGSYKDGKGQVIGVVVLISLTSEISQIQQELRLLLDHVPAGIMVRSKSGEILRINQHSAQILNAPIDQLEGRNISDFGVPETLLREDREVIETGRPMLNVVHELTSADGRSIWIRLDRVPFPNPETGETCVYSMAQNVTDIYAAERALRQSEERFDLAVKGSGVGIWDWDLENGTFFWSARCLEILGIDGDSLVGRPDTFWDLLHPDDRDRVKAAREAHFERREPYDVHFRVRRTDGTYRWIESRGQALRDSHGKATRFIGSADDITQRRRDEVALRVKTEQMALAEKMGGIGHWRVDLNDNSVFWSDQVYVIHGEMSESHTPDLESGINFYHPDDREMVRTCVAEGIENGKPFEFETRLVRRSGEERIVQSICHTEKDHDGTITALFGVISDVTERREQERERERTLDELFRSNAELSRFSFVCSHDLKEPVRTLNNMAELLLDDDAKLDESERRDLLNRIRKNSKRLAGMIESLLAFSRIDGKLTIESVDLDEIVTEIRENLNAAIDEAEATFDVASLPTIQGAKVHFRQLFQNLLSNALKFGASRRLQDRDHLQGRRRGLVDYRR